jgi:hypothetical protein
VIATSVSPSPRNGVAQPGTTETNGTTRASACHANQGGTTVPSKRKIGTPQPTHQMTCQKRAKYPSAATTATPNVNGLNSGAVNIHARSRHEAGSFCTAHSRCARTAPAWSR